MLYHYELSEHVLSFYRSSKQHHGLDAQQRQKRFDDASKLKKAIRSTIQNTNRTRYEIKRKLMENKMILLSDSKLNSISVNDNTVDVIVASRK